VDQSTANPRCGKLNEREKGSASLVVADGDTAKLLQLVEEAFDMIALTIDRLLPAKARFAIGRGGDVGDPPV
jgi:hypothetical protein